ncbi:MAG: VOC family protein [Solirubrobacterales bacterium]
MPNQIVHFEILGKDAAETKRFYTEMFDWKLQEIGGPSDYATVVTGEQAIGGGLGGKPDGMDDFEPYVTFYVNVDDVGAALEKAEKLGGTAVMGPHRVEDPDIPGDPFTIGQFLDPEGKLVGLHAIG